jgi:hypothetical protein
MRTQSHWLFETPLMPETTHYSNLEFEDEWGFDGFENDLEWETGPTINLDKAVDYNRSKIAIVGWQNYVDNIVKLLGFSTFTPDERTFAQAVANWQQKQGLNPDGMIGPGTWAKIQTALKIKPATPMPSGSTGLYPIVNIKLPERGIGFRSRTENRYGLPETILALMTIGMKWYSTDPSRPIIVISDISKQGGGKLSRGGGKFHKSHRIGLDVDLGFRRMQPKNSGSTRVCTIDPDYASDWRSLTQELVNTIRSNGILKVNLIGFAEKFADKADKKVSVTSLWDDHRCHLHVRFCMPPNTNPFWIYQKLMGAAKNRITPASHILNSDV